MNQTHNAAFLLLSCLLYIRSFFCLVILAFDHGNSVPRIWSLRIHGCSLNTFSVCPLLQRGRHWGCSLRSRNPYPQTTPGFSIALLLQDLEHLWSNSPMFKIAIFVYRSGNTLTSLSPTPAAFFFQAPPYFVSFPLTGEHIVGHNPVRV